MQLTDRDAALVRFIGRFPFVVQEQVESWFRDVAGGGSARSIAYTRLKLLSELELVQFQHILASTGRAIWLTRAGMRFAGVTGQARAPRISQFVHDKTLTDLALWVLVNKPGHEVVTEREMRAMDTLNQESDRPARWASGAGRTRAFPDLVTIHAASGARVLHEVENSVKERSRMHRLMVQHASQPTTAALRYYGTSELVLDRLHDVAEQARETLARRGVRTPITIKEAGSW